jgi:PmbA protein
MNDASDLFERLNGLTRMAMGEGADAADAIWVERRSLSVACRFGQREQVEREEQIEVGLRALIGKRQAVVSSSDLSHHALAKLAERAVAMAEAVPADPFCGLAEPDELATDVPDVDSCDPIEPDTETLLARAMAAEDAARAVAGITNSEGGEASWSTVRSAMVGSNGFARARSRSRHSVAVSVLAGSGSAMERDYDFASTVYAADLPSPEAIGRAAGERAVRRLGPRKVNTAKVPVVYEARVARSLLGHLAQAINGSAIARGTSFLLNEMGERILPAALSVVDDPHRRRGLASRPFDGEGLPTRRLAVVDRGVLTSWLLDLRSARQLGLASTGHGSRGTSAPPSPAPSNLYLAPGSMSPEALIAEIECGLFVTELIGFGVNAVTGDYSRGASGFWIEKGAIAYPVSEVTVAGNLLDMFQHLTPASDLVFRHGTDSPTLRVDGMTVAGR